jgi:UDP-glucose 4-epimerase
MRSWVVRRLTGSIVLACVIGRGGFLGSAVSVALSRRGIPEFVSGSTLAWPTRNDAVGIEQFKFSLDIYLRELLATQKCERIVVFWCAGRSFPRSNRLDVDLDQSLFELAMGSFFKYLSESQIHIIYSSSAGGIYSTSTNYLIGSDSKVSPRTPYGIMKLAAEQYLQEVSCQNVITSTIARISNIYGPGQDLAKAQGIISKLAVSGIRKVPIPIFVPLDTVRNYIYVDDAAEKLVRFAKENFGISSIQMVTSPENLSLSSVIGTCNRVFHRRPLVVHCDLGIADQHSRSLAMRSSFDRNDRHTSFSHGLMKVWSDILRRSCTARAAMWEPIVD